MMHARFCSVVLLVWVVVCPSVLGSPQAAPEESQTGDPKLDYKLRSARADSEYDEICDSADEIAHLAEDVSKRLVSNGHPADQLTKDLDRLRKLARKVRSQLGGSGDPHMDPAPANPSDAAAALEERSRTLADALRQSTRYEVNARGIILASEIVYLVDLLRQFEGIDR